MPHVLLFQHMKPSIILPAALSLLTLLFLSSCGNHSFSSDALSVPSYIAPASAKVGQSRSIERKVKRSGNLSLKSSNLKKAAAETQSHLDRYQARFDSSSLSKKAYSAHIRVPSASLEPLVNDLSQMGRVTHRRITMKDVTESYLDLQAALKNKRALRDRLRNLLNKAQQVEDILKIEQELSRVQTELDTMEARMKLMSSQLDLSSLHFKIDKSSIPGPLGLITRGGSWTVRKLFTLN